MSNKWTESTAEPNSTEVPPSAANGSWVRGAEASSGCGAEAEIWGISHMTVPGASLVTSNDNG